MSEIPSDTADVQPFRQTDFERITQLVTAEFKIQEALLEQGNPTYYLAWPQETKQQFLRLLKHLEEINLIAFLRKTDDKVVLRVVPKPPVKPGNARKNLILLLATVATTFITGYIGFPETGINPIVSGAIFSAAILLVLGIHEMGHKLTANKREIDASSPYFIPGPPPLGTMGAVIMQKSLPRNRDSLFDVGASGPITGFIVALVFSAIGLLLLIPAPGPPDLPSLNLMPTSWILLLRFFSSLLLLPQAPPDGVLLLHPLTWAGWAGMVVTMINLLPAAMLDGGHVTRSTITKDKLRLFLTFASAALLLIVGTEFIIMAFLIIFMSMFKHPGPLDDVSNLSRNRKLLTVVLMAIFILAFPIRV
ncbi:MAG: site-2 protease family protein [Candidatus Bathyarchaeota archaeon]|nr:site-2 protease family protein [Candidatus Bathyarchaeota archaeon]